MIENKYVHDIRLFLFILDKIVKHIILLHVKIFLVWVY